MARYRKVDPRIWNDAKFASLSDRGKLVFLFLLTHPHMTSLGAMRATIAGMAAELGWTEEAFREAFGEAFRKALLEHDEKASFVCLPNFLKYNRPESPNVVKSWDSAIDLLPECELKDKVLQRVKAFAEGFGKSFQEALPKAFREAFRKPSLNPEPEPEQEQEQEQDLNPGSGSGRGAFAKVTEETLRDTRKLVDWWEAASKGRGAVVGRTDDDRVNVVAAAERALEQGDKPVALWVALVKNRRWKLLTNEQIDRARGRLLELKRANGHAPPRKLQELGAKLGLDDTEVPPDE